MEKKTKEYIEKFGIAPTEENRLIMGEFAVLYVHCLHAGAKFGVDDKIIFQPDLIRLQDSRVKISWLGDGHKKFISFVKEKHDSEYPKEIIEYVNGKMEK